MSAARQLRQSRTIGRAHSPKHQSGSGTRRRIAAVKRVSAPEHGLAEFMKSLSDLSVYLTRWARPPRWSRLVPRRPRLHHPPPWTITPSPGLPSRGPCGDGAYLPSPFWCWRRPTIHIRETTTAPSGMAPCSRLLASAKSSPRRSGSYRRFTCLGGIFSGGLAVTVYSPPMTGNRPELPGSSRRFEIVNPVATQ